MKAVRMIFSALLFLALPALAMADETIVFLRHAEKPADGLGQLTCQGLNRSLALPSVLHAQFGKPTAIFAVNAGERKKDKGVPYSYVRPLATIEPTAIQNGLPVNDDLAFTDTQTLNATLLKPEYSNATVFIAWEHHLVVKAVRDLMKQFDVKEDIVPDWNDKDFDSIYVVHVTNEADGKRKASFELKKEGLNGLSNQCVQVTTPRTATAG